MRVRNTLKIAIIIMVCSYQAGYGETRMPAVSGTFYPANAAKLRQMVETHLAGAGDIETIDGEIVALIVPHAGLVYSGGIAAHSYSLLKESGIERVILCGPSHRYPFDGLSVYGRGIRWQTPLGSVNCSDEMCGQLTAFDSRIGMAPEAHRSEHCLEVQLPYLQSVLGDFEIVPILMGYPNNSTVNLLADALASVASRENTVMVASTDWQHYRSAEQGWKMDSLGIECLKSMDPDRLLKYTSSGKVEMCGGGSAVAVMKAAIARGADRVKILKYGDSGDVSGDKNQVVGYAAAVFYRSSGHSGMKGSEMSIESDSGKSTESSHLTDEEKTRLLGIARESIISHLTGSGTPKFEVSGVLADDGAAFVTLEKAGNLRGCIGHTMAVAPLYKTVSDCAVHAAVRDPRFSPVTEDEVKDLHIEISVLTPLEKIESLDEIKVGRDGLMITMGPYSGLLLPQVATDYGWNETEFLMHTCQKAGLPSEAYQSEDAEIYTFQAIIFSEE